MLGSATGKREYRNAEKKYMAWNLQQSSFEKASFHILMIFDDGSQVSSIVEDGQV